MSKAWNDLELLNAALDGGMAVYRHYMGHDIKPFRKYLSPLRDENHPSFSIYMSDKTGMWHYSDFGISSAEREGNHWEFIKAKEGVGFRDAVELAKSRILHITGAGFNGVLNPAVFELKPIQTRRSPVLIEPKARELTPSDLLWWQNKGRISRNTLDVFYAGAASAFTIEKDRASDGERIRFTIDEKPSDPIYTFSFPETGHVKVYRPLNPETKFKWSSNTDAKRDLFGLHLMPAYAEKGFLTAGNSDTMAFWENIASQLGYACFTLNSENAKMTNEIWQLMQTISPNWFSLYDNDKDKTVTDKHGQKRIINTGRQQTQELFNTWGLTPANEILAHEGVKDTCQLIMKNYTLRGERGLQELRDHFESL